MLNARHHSLATPASRGVIAGPLRTTMPTFSSTSRNLAPCLEARSLATKPSQTVTACCSETVSHRLLSVLARHLSPPSMAQVIRRRSSIAKTALVVRSAQRLRCRTIHQTAAQRHLHRWRTSIRPSQRIVQTTTCMVSQALCRR